MIDAPSSARLAVPALLLANAVLACGAWLVRLAESQGQVGPVGSAFWRLALAFPFVLAAARIREAMPPRWGAPVGIALLAGLLFAADLAVWHLGVLHTRLSNATLLGNVTAILFPAYGFLVARRWPTARQGIALALAAAGAVLLVGRSFELAARNVGGDLLSILAGMFFTGYLIAIDRVRGALGPLTAFGVAIGAGLPVLLATALALGETVWPHVWWPLVLLALGSQIVGQGLVLYAVGRVSPLVVGLMLLVQPTVAAGIGWMAYRERLGLPDAIGALAIGAAVLLVRDMPPRLQAGENGLSPGA